MATVSGPLFSFEADAMVKRWARQEQHRIAQEGLRRVREHLHAVERRQTGYDAAHVVVEDRGTVSSNVIDSNVTYGGWLEGVTSRNDTTRFKGYHTFKLVGAQLEKDSRLLMQADIRPLLKELNG